MDGMSKRWLLAAAAVWAAGAAVAPAAEWHVKPEATAEGKGTLQEPWHLQAALNHPPAVKPGDTIWVHQGEYPGRFQSQLQGTREKPIVVRAAAGERATLRGGLVIGQNTPSQHTWYWGLEVSQRKLNGHLVDGVTISNLEGNTPGIKVINCIIHDTGGVGVSTWGGAHDNEVNGCVIYNNGFDNPKDRGHGHGFYIQSRTGPKLIKDNVIFRNFSKGTQLYGSENAPRNNVTHEGNTVFNNSEISRVVGRQGSLASNKVNAMHIEGGQIAEKPNLIANMVYAPPWAKESIGNLMGNSSDALIKGNYMVALSPEPVVVFRLRGKNAGLKMVDNTFFGDPNGFAIDEYGPGNVRLAERPKEPKVFVRPNDYEKGRAHITIFNWPLKDKVEVDVKPAGLKEGQLFELRDAQNFYGQPVLKGKFEGKPLAVPMTGLSVAPLEGLDEQYKTPEHTAPEFGVFVLLPVGE